MSKNIEHDGVRWIQTPLKMVLQFIELFNYPICLDLNESKRVVIDYDKTSIADRLQKLEDKSITHIYLRDEDMMAFMRDVKKILEQEKIESGVLSPKEIMSEVCSISTCYEFMKTAFMQLGFSERSLILAEEINRRSMKAVRDTPNLVELLRNLRNDLHPHFMRALLSGSMSACLVDAFNWGNEEIKEKVSLGAMLTQLNWEQKHFDIFDEGTQLHSLKMLPVEMAEKLRRANTFSKEVIEIVEQAFENPERTGFPRGIDSTGIGRLPALHIVSSQFIKKLVEREFDYSAKKQIVEELKAQYNQGQFVQIMEGVSRMFAA
tara:strand:- start:54164 stop:55123 length:960 start_codon:yes stop_codon:yes gene_type:complete